jgi:hypothetical protein
MASFSMSARGLSSGIEGGPLVGLWFYFILDEGKTEVTRAQILSFLFARI